MTLPKTAHQFVAIEGPAFAGKTTILKYLHDHYADSICVAPEASEYVGGDHNFPNVPFSSFDAARASSHFFLEVERLRCEEARKTAEKQPKKTVVFDRATLLSSVLFYSLLERKFPKMHGFAESFTQHALELFAAELEAGTFFIPEKMILIKPKNKAIFESRLSRGTKNSMFGHWSSVTFLVDEYMKIINSNFQSKTLILETENTQENLRKNAEKIIEFLSTPITQITTQTVFSEYQTKKIAHVFAPDVYKEKETYSASIERARTLVERAACHIH